MVLWQRLATADVCSRKDVEDELRRLVDGSDGRPEDERKKLLRQVRLRWHPDKHPVLNSLAHEVMQIINRTVADNKASAPPSDVGQAGPKHG